MSLNLLPDDVIVEISSRVAASSIPESFNLQLISKLFLRLCNESYVLRHYSFHVIPLFPWKHCAKISKLVNRCCKSGNTDANYRNGLVKFFNQNSSKKQQWKGLTLIASASNKGHLEAKYIYGMILICLGGQSKVSGFTVLSSLTRPFLSRSLEIIEKHKCNLRRNLWWYEEEMMLHLKQSNAHDKCICDGKTKDFIIAVTLGWNKVEDIKVSCACENCLFNHEVQLFLEK